VLAFAALLSVGSGLLAGIVTALRASAVDVNEHLKEAGRGSSEGRSARRTQSVLVTAQVSLALVLLVCAGLLVRSLQHLNSVDPGFNPSHLLTFEVVPPAAHFDTAVKRETLFRRIGEGLEAMPGVASVSAINHLPIGGDVWTYRYEIPGRPAPLPGHEFGAVYRIVRPGYFSTMQTPLVRGRGIERRDEENAAKVVVINQTMARHQWPNEDPTGRTITLPEQGSTAEPLTVVGVVKDVRQSEWTGPVDDEVYLPFAQRSKAFGSASQTFVIRTNEDPDVVASRLDRSSLGIDSDVPISRRRSMDQVISEKLWRSKVSTVLLTVFALIALFLAAAGIYSVIAFSVRRRTQELGIRVALGASPGAVLRMVLKESFGPVLAGVLLGTGGSVIAVRLLDTLLYGVTPGDPLTFTLVVAGMFGVSAVATTIPALHALRSDPLSALRHSS